MNVSGTTRNVKLTSTPVSYFETDILRKKRFVSLYVFYVASFRTKKYSVATSVYLYRIRVFTHTFLTFFVDTPILNFNNGRPVRGVSSEARSHNSRNETGRQTLWLFFRKKNFDGYLRDWFFIINRVRRFPQCSFFIP